MSRLTAENESRLGPRPGDEWRGGQYLMEREEGGRSSWGWWIGALALVGVGAWAAYYLGPDLRRYLKIRSM